MARVWREPQNPARSFITRTNGLFLKACDLINLDTHVLIFASRNGETRVFNTHPDLVPNWDHAGADRLGPADVQNRQAGQLQVLRSLSHSSSSSSTSASSGDVADSLQSEVVSLDWIPPRSSPLPSSSARLPSSTPPLDDLFDLPASPIRTPPKTPPRIPPARSNDQTAGRKRRADTISESPLKKSKVSKWIDD